MSTLPSIRINPFMVRDARIWCQINLHNEKSDEFGNPYRFREIHQNVVFGKNSYWITYFVFEQEADATLFALTCPETLYV